MAVLLARIDSTTVGFSAAIKFTPSGGRIDIECKETHAVVLMRVSDTGIGIPSDKLEAIFEPFVQVQAGSLGPGAGIGLGLSISRDLSRDMHGDLTVKSTLGQGAQFSLTLPRSLAVLHPAAPGNTL